MSAQVDDKGNLHIAAQEANSGKLYYLYMTKSGDSYSIAKTVLVDCTASVGNWTEIQLGAPKANSTTWYDYKPVISYLNKSSLNTTAAAKIAYVDKYTIDATEETASWEAMTDPSKYEGKDTVTSIVTDAYETKGGIKSPIAIGFNSDFFAVDFLRDEK